MTSNGNIQVAANAESATPANTERSHRLWWGFLLLLLVLTAAGCGDPPAKPDRPDGNQPASTTDASTPQTGRREPGTDVFIDVAETAGIDFVHFNGMSGEIYLCEVKSVGCGLFDYDNDGDLDVYLIQGSMLGENKTFADATFPPKGPLPPKDRLYRNDLVVGPDAAP